MTANVGSIDKVLRLALAIAAVIVSRRLPSAAGRGSQSTTIHHAT